MSVRFIGPFEEWRVVVDGWEVPMVTAQPLKGGRVSVTIDRRFGLELSISEAERFVPFLAHAIAIAGGFACHPRGDAEPLPLSSSRPRRLTQLG